MSAYLARAVPYVGPLHRSQRGVLEALATMANGEGQCFPSHDRLAAAAGLSASTVARCLNGLEAAGLIARDRQRRNDGTPSPAVITVFPMGAPGPGRPHAAIVAERAGEGARNG